MLFRLRAPIAQRGGGRRRRDRDDGAMADDPPVRVIWSPRGNRAEVRLLRCQVFEISPRARRGGFRARPTSARAILQAAKSLSPRPPHTAAALASKGRLIRCTVPGSAPNRLAMTRTPGRPGVARASRIRFSSAGAIGGRPRRLPSLLARASPEPPAGRLGAPAQRRHCV